MPPVTRLSGRSSELDAMGQLIANVRIMAGTALAGATLDIDGGQQLA